MGEFFHGWRRKLGMLTLGMACMFMVGWARSEFYSEFFRISFNNKFDCYLFTYPGMFRPYAHFREAEWNSPVAWRADRLDRSQRAFQIAQAYKGGWPPVHYWSVVLPLTLLAAYLLLSKPRAKKTSAKST